MMNALNATPAAMQQSFTDLSSLDAIRQKGRDNSDEALEEIAKQFESMLVRMMLKSMRDANDVFAKGNPLSSNEGKTYEQMYDDQLALTLSVGRGMGIADVMVRQLKQAHGTAPQGSAKAAELEAGPQANLQHQSQVASPSPSATSSQVQASSDWRSDLVLQRAASAQSMSTQPVTNTAVAAPISFDGSVAHFVKQLYPLAEQAAKNLAVDPETLIAQAALETGWGEKITTSAAGSSNNLFNIKADHRWQGDAVRVNTLEFRDGIAVKETAAFRAYNSLSESFDDYVDFINGGERYSQARAATDGESYIRKLSEAGYATDPRYADKVINIVNSQSMQAALADAKRAAGSF